MIKIDIVSGFLGAGKTTLIRKLFESSQIKKEQVVIIENEFGEIGIDGSFLKDSGIKIKEINAGCICCSLVGDFEKSIKELVATYNPDRIIIEPSGVGKLSDIIVAVKKVDLDIKVNMLVTVVDAGKVKAYLKNFGEFFNNQVLYADTIVVGKVDKCSEEKLVESVELIKGVNAKANIITTNINTLDADKLISFLEEKASLREELVAQVQHEHEDDDDDEECDDPNCSCHHHHHHHHDDDDECCCHHDEDEEHEHHHHHDDDDDECCCCHHDEDEEHEHEHHHHHDDDDDECCCCHHDEDEEHEHEHHHHHDDDDDECCCHHDEDEEHEHEHHHHHHDDEECDDPNCSCHHHHHHHHGHDADEVFTSWGMETPRSFTHDELDAFLKVLADENSGLGIVLRSKGILKASDNEKWYYFDLVAGDYEIRLGEPDYTGRVVVIGSHIDEDKIAALFNKKANA